VRKRLYISIKSIEVDKPSGGGKGPDAPYILFVSIDGHPALQLTTSSFKQAGQMVALAEILAPLCGRDISETKP
jgi:hypothetical protein